MLLILLDDAIIADHKVDQTAIQVREQVTLSQRRGSSLLTHVPLILMATIANHTGRQKS